VQDAANKQIASFAIGFILAIMLMAQCQSERENILREVTRTDTVWQERVIPQEVVKIVERPTVRRDTVYIAYMDSTFIGELFTFKDTANVGGVIIPYKITSTGLITDLRLGAIFDYPTITHTTSRTITRPPRGLYAGATVGQTTASGATVLYVRGNFAAGYTYHSDRSSSITAVYKIF
jgi:hypothetical protein